MACPMTSRFTSTMLACPSFCTWATATAAWAASSSATCSDSSPKAPGSADITLSAPRSSPWTNNCTHSRLVGRASAARATRSGHRSSPGRSSTRTVCCSNRASRGQLTAPFGAGDASAHHFRTPVASGASSSPFRGGRRIVKASLWGPREEISSTPVMSSELQDQLEAFVVDQCATGRSLQEDRRARRPHPDRRPARTGRHRQGPDADQHFPAARGVHTPSRTRRTTPSEASTPTGSSLPESAHRARSRSV